MIKMVYNEEISEAYSTHKRSRWKAAE